MCGGREESEEMAVPWLRGMWGLVWRPRARARARVRAQLGSEGEVGE